MSVASVQPEPSAARLSTRVRDLRAYIPPEVPPFVDLRLDANEGAGPSEAAMAALRGAGAESARRYPDARALEAAIAARHGVDPERVVVTGGGDDAIDRACRAFLEPGRDLVTHEPTFEMIGRSARLAGAAVRSTPWLGGGFPADELIGSISSETGLVALVTPNNPTGGVIPAVDVVRVARAAAGVRAAVMVDLAYAEFADDDPTAALAGESNVVIVRTFSKALGLAGLRVGYAVAPAGIADALRAAGGPYPVSGPALDAAASALGGNRAFTERVRSERSRLSALLRELGCGVLDSQANFVAAAFDDADLVHRALASLGIAVRRFASRPELRGYLRITLPGCDRSFGRLERALRAALDPEALLLDLDGVLADVSGSYREAIVRTARSFGVDVTRAEVAEEKRRGGSNNDWEVTARLIARRGVTAPLAEITERFQAAYAGPGGLRESESLIPDADVVRRLADRLPIAVVTGRPRDEAAWFLERAGLTPLVRALVCMEDAEAKPSPAPVRLALERLGVERAWMVGDTPDDMEAARLAGVVPVGVIAPGDDGGASRGALERAGAARVARGLEDVLEMLP